MEIHIMKKSAILKLFSLVTFAAAGAFAIANVKSAEKAESVSATGTKRVFIDFDTIDFTTNAYCYYYGGSGVPSWPGEHLNTANKIDKSSIVFSSRATSERDFYYWDIPDDNTTAIFCNSDGGSGDPWNRWDGFDLSTKNLFQANNWSGEYSSWNVYKITLKKSNSTTLTEYTVPAWSGSGYSAPTPTSGYRWVVESTSAVFADGTAITGDIVLQEQLIPATTYDVKFYLEDKTTLYDTVTVNEGGTAVCSKADPTKAQSGKEVYTFAGWVNNDGTPATLSNVQSNFSVYASFSTDYAAGRYVVGIGGHWDAAHGELMSYDSVKGEYSVTVNLAFNDEIKIVYYDGTDIQWNKDTDVYEKLVPSAEAYHYFGPGDGGDYNGHNIKCWAAGSYTFYFTDSNYDESYKSSVAHAGPLTAQHLAAQLMGLSEYEGHCGDSDRFPAMKQFYLEQLSETEQSNFRGYATSEVEQFKNAYDRYVAWAAALHQKPWEAGEIAASQYVISSTDSSNLIVIVSIVSLISASTLVGLIVIKRRRGIAK